MTNNSFTFIHLKCFILRRIQSLSRENAGSIESSMYTLIHI